MAKYKNNQNMTSGFSQTYMYCIVIILIFLSFNNRNSDVSFHNLFKILSGPILFRSHINES